MIKEIFSQNNFLIENFYVPEKAFDSTASTSAIRLWMLLESTYLRFSQQLNFQNF